MGPIELAEAWNRYKLDLDSRARDRIIEHYAYLVKITAGRAVSKMPSGVDRDDLESAGAMGLIKAVDQFDPSRQVKFETYAIALIRGAILESVRRDDWVPRSVREKVRSLQRAYVDIEMRNGRPATDEEVAEALQMSQEELQKLLTDAGRCSVFSIEDVLVGDGSGDRLPISESIPDDGAGPGAEAEMLERKRQLTAAINRLPDRERTVIALYYYEGMTFREIGTILTISESRVYQLHTQCVLRMRGYLQADRELFH